jgi:DNA end-binding protein Ku
MADDDVATPRPFWSGILAFGLVSIPVSLFPAHGTSRASLRMVDGDGTPLRRQYVCEQEDVTLEPDDLVRGYEFDKNQYVIVEDQEIEALEPEKSQEIDLSRFVALAEVNPVYFERAYFLVPDKGATKAYRLLAKSMEDQQRAGIATFVMRGKEYLVAIVAERGILRAETMRFSDELRAPADIGLPEPAKPAAKLVAAFRRIIEDNTREALDRDDLTDTYSQKLRDYAEKKYRSGRDVVAAPTDETADDDEQAKVVDLMQVIKQRLQGQDQDTVPRARTPGETM